MTADQIGGIARAILAGIGGIFVTKGYLSADLLNTIVGGLITVGSGIWSVWTNRPSKVISS